MNLTFFLIMQLTALPGQALEPPTGLQSFGGSVAERFAEAERQLQSFRSEWVATAVTFGSDGKPIPIAGPNEKLMTLESVATELELDCLGKKALWEQLSQFGPGQMPITPQLQALLRNDPTLARYEADLKKSKEVLDHAKQQYGNKHRVVIQYEQQYHVAKQRFDEETAVKTLTFNNQQIAQAQLSYLRSQDMLLKANDQLVKVKAEQRYKDARMAEYLRLVETRDTLRLKLLEEEEASELGRLRGMTLDELKAAVDRTSAALEKARRTHQHVVAALNEAIEQSKLSGDGDNTSQPDSKPVGE